MADNGMVERVARALSLDLGENPDDRDVLIRDREGRRPHWEGYESTALAAIAAMPAATDAGAEREVVEQFAREIATRKGLPHDSHHHWHDIVERIWKAGYAAALPTKDR